MGKQIFKAKLAEDCAVLAANVFQTICQKIVKKIQNWQY